MHVFLKRSFWNLRGFQFSCCSPVAATESPRCWVAALLGRRAAESPRC